MGEEGVIGFFFGGEVAKETCLQTDKATALSHRQTRHSQAHTTSAP